MRHPQTSAHHITDLESMTLGRRGGQWSRRQFAFATLAGCLTVQSDAIASQRESLLPLMTAERLLATIAVGPSFVAGGEKVEALGQSPSEPARFAFVGDLQIQLKFTLPPSFRGQMVNASMADLARLGLSPQRGFELAKNNALAALPPPSPGQPIHGMSMLVSQSPTGMADGSSYLLDRSFWLEASRSSPGGLVVTVPDRQIVMYAPAGDSAAITLLKQRAQAARRRTAAPTKWSSALLAFNNDRWSALEQLQLTG